MDDWLDTLLNRFSSASISTNPVNPDEWISSLLDKPVKPLLQSQIRRHIPGTVPNLNRTDLVKRNSGQTMSTLEKIVEYDREGLGESTEENPRSEIAETTLNQSEDSIEAILNIRNDLMNWEIEYLTKKRKLDVSGPIENEEISQPSGHGTDPLLNSSSSNQDSISWQTVFRDCEDTPSKVPKVDLEMLYRY